MSQQQPGMKRDPIFWTTTVPGYNDNDRQRFVTKAGKRLREKIPQRGHDGDYDDRRRAQHGIRFVTLIRHDGHEISHCLTNGAAHLNHMDAYGQYAMIKARALGWYLAGECPCALVASKVITRDHLVSDEVRNGQPCQAETYSHAKPCKHSIAELEARRAVHRAEELEREQNYRSKEDKLLDAQREQTQALVSAILKGQVAAVAPAAAAAAAPASDPIADTAAASDKPAPTKPEKPAK